MLSKLILVCLLAFASVFCVPLSREDETDTDFFALWEKNGHRMALILMDTEDVTELKMLDCHLVGDETIIHEVLKNIPAEQVIVIEPEDMSRTIAECTIVQQSQKAPKKKGLQRSSITKAVGNWIADYFIMPGTKWCGAGDIADSYDDLGTEVETDKCCRTHDHCNDTMEARGEKYGLKNSAVHTKCHCDCDSKFYKCLIDAGTETAETVGNFFFNRLQVQCFKMDHPIVKCHKYHKWAYMFYSCQEYELDETKPLIWQFFDAKYFEMPGRSQEKNKTTTRRRGSFWPSKPHRLQPIRVYS